jgi:hypothetical protein
MSLLKEDFKPLKILPSLQFLSVIPQGKDHALTIFQNTAQMSSTCEPFTILWWN